MTELLKQHPNEPHDDNISARLNWLRAGVLGANDGIVSVAATVVGVAGVTNDVTPILVAGTAAVVGGAVSMALGEYVSVSSQSDSQRALIEKERQELRDDPAGELEELAAIYQTKGLTEATARTVASELTEHDALGAHLEAELKIDEAEVVNAWHAAFASAIAFTVGAVLPLLAILLPPAEIRVPSTFVAVVVALVITGTVSARIGGSSKRKATLRLVIGGALAMAFTYAVGLLLGTTGIA
ncbi:VIT1/CCC1 transporter family protein [Paenarthrobacter aromaticivorans]|uniref:VIT family protein n=1 Tax=Paenarthrobacter aromaticivorans TaxID=2849150 RepID=A0ABS6I2H0_9MICC|nr:VIT family protein [Paenarthrobacter sp. MMS21-TAE1-1]MBU8864983.1 VIT family protein [Paenarthrobacter sp. MMS21-TAE1-1]